MAKKCKNPKCKTCRYRALKTDVNTCDYICITGKSRNCTVENCDKYEKGERLPIKKEICYGEKVQNNGF